MPPTDSSPFVRRNPHELPHLIGSVLDQDVRHLFPADFVVCSELFDLYIVQKILEVFKTNRIGDAVAAGKRTEEIVSDSGFANQAFVPMDWMIQKLRAEGLPNGEPLPEPSPARYKDEALSINPRCAPSFAIVEALASQTPEYFRGQKTGEEILFAPNRISLWSDYFSNDHLLYAVNNRVGAEALVRALPEGKARILELGGGLGSAASAIVERLAEGGDLERVEEYILTDVVPMFLGRAERTLCEARSEFPLVVQRADINKPLTQQGIAPESMDIVYAVNTIHVAQDLSKTLGFIWDVLKPGGSAVFSECMRPYANQPVYIEFIFNFLAAFRDVKIDAANRPVHGFLTPACWRNSLAAARFRDVRILPDVDKIKERYAYFFAAAVTGVKRL